MVHLRRLRASELDELPRHYEGMVLRPAARLTGWLLALALVAWGVGAMVRGTGGWLEAAGAAAAAMGGVMLVALVRLRRYEIIVGDRWIRVGAGPLAHRFGRHGTRTGGCRPATSWRRLYASTQLVLRAPAGGPVLAVPVRDAAELEAVLVGGERENAAGGTGVGR